MSNQKNAAESYNSMTQMIFPYDVNMHGTLMGGKLMYWMDMACAISGMKHCNAPIVTIAIDSLTFDAPIYISQTLQIITKVTRAFRTSMEVKVEVWREDLIKKEKAKTNEAYFTVVAVDKNLKPIEVPTVIPQTEEEKHEYEKATERRSYRLSKKHN